ncbi:hypothetical protein VNO77_12709 [Canavalia gladiata]|uniref:AIPP2-like SPOC-like domain-containing protein n=1 Tax=Canavalia gladiata TaxID=3824 RepID=A0AAN9LX06_CANGL
MNEYYIISYGYPSKHLTHTHIKPKLERSFTPTFRFAPTFTTQWKLFVSSVAIEVFRRHWFFAQSVRLALCIGIYCLLPLAAFMNAFVASFCRHSWPPMPLPLTCYCLDGPVVFTELVTWFCEDCEGKLVVPPLDQSKHLSSVTSHAVNLENNAIQIRREFKNCIQRVKKKNTQQKRKIKKKLKKRKKNSGLVAKTKNLLNDSHSSPELEHEHPQHSISCEEENELKKECGPAPRDTANSDVVSKSVPVSEGATTDDSSSVDLDSHVSQPIIDPIWRYESCFASFNLELVNFYNYFGEYHLKLNFLVNRGRLDFCDETIGTVGGLLAHLSNLACSKVVEEMKLLPELLHAELLPRSMVWPKSFKNGGPTDKSIALYFFPESERAEKTFDMLVDDIIRLEHAIRFVAENAELLIFPSTALPIQHWRFQAKYYLWGVFRRKQTLHKTDGVCRENAAVDRALNFCYLFLPPEVFDCSKQALGVGCLFNSPGVDLL